MWKLSIEDDQANQTVVDLMREEYAIGRDVLNTVRLTERNISRKHAVLRRNGSGWLVRDSGSYNGCFVNGVRVAGEEPLKHGDLLQLGDYRLELVDDDAATRADPESKTATLPGRQSQTIRELPNRLVMILGPTVGASFPLMDKRIVIGRGEDCDLPVNDTSVSRVHAEIHAIEGGRYEVVDRDSSNGVRVNGVELKRSILDAGDVVELGDVQLRYVPAGQVYHPQEPLLGRRSSETAAGSDRAAPAAGRTRSMVIVAIVLLAVVAAGFAYMMRNDEPPISGGPTEASPAARTLEQAKQLLATGDVEGALKRAEQIPEDSNLRESTAFKEIQAKWADSLFDQASQETDRTRKRSILDRIAKSPDVGSMQRKRASNEIQALDADSVGIEQLPAAEKTSRPPESPPPKTAEALPLPPPEKPAPPPATSPAAPKPPKKTSEVKNGLVRDTPF
jgi:pSer/pThr/pTyr-binding forkhead associated (FHA) protein